jgi:N-acetylglucosaminyldiphosphoundecaprenol N-acetyl-beta-D-mannosaminyltransferase
MAGYASAARPTKTEERAVRETIARLRPQLVFVALGAPQQEQWVVDHLSLLTQQGAKVVMVVGGAFDILLGRLRRAPLWMRSLGLEWLYRLMQEPWRAGRQAALLTFIKLVVQELFSRKK